MSIKLSEASVKKVIDAGANHWVKGDFDRYYIDVKDLVDYDFYKSGNVKHAFINDEKISNTEGTRLLNTKIFVENNELVGDSEELLELAMNRYGLEETAEETSKVEDSDNTVAKNGAQNPLDAYLQSQNITRYQISRLTDVGATTLQRATEKNATNINPRVMVAVAEVLKKTPGQVFDDLIEMEMANDMTVDETKLLLIKVLDDSDATALVTVEHMGDGFEAVVAEIDLPSGDTIRFAINHRDNAITKYDVLNELAYAMDDYDHVESEEYFPTDQGGDTNQVLVNAEYFGVSQADSEYLSSLSSKIFKMRK